MRGKELPTESNMQKTSPWLIATRVLFTFALIACIVAVGVWPSGAQGLIYESLGPIMEHLNLF